MIVIFYVNIFKMNHKGINIGEGNYLVSMI